MKKTALFLFFIPALILIQSCKKDAATSTDTTVKPVFQAYIGTPVWTPDTVAAKITYNTTTKKKTFTISGQKSQSKIDIIFTDPTSADNESISTGEYKVDGTSYLQFIYSKQEKDVSGNYVFKPFGTVAPNSGTLVISSVDIDKHTITGTFKFTPSEIIYDSNGNVTSSTSYPINLGTIQDMPYTFTREQ